MIDKDVQELNAFFGTPKYNKPVKMTSFIASPEWPNAGDQSPWPWPYPTDRFPSFHKERLVIPNLTEAQKAQKEECKKAMQKLIDEENAAKAKKMLEVAATPIRVAEDQAVRADTGKLDWSLVPIDAVEEITKVLEFGAKKYTAHNWKVGGGFSWVRVFNSLVRHIFAWARGEDKDPESGLSHLAHAGCNIFFLLHYSNNKNKYDKDDRV